MDEFRYDYQHRFVNFDVQEGSTVLDIGSGGNHYPYATVLLDRFLQQSEHRHADRVNGGPNIILILLGTLAILLKRWSILGQAAVQELQFARVAPPPRKLASIFSRLIEEIR